MIVLFDLGQLFWNRIDSKAWSLPYFKQIQVELEGQLGLQVGGQVQFAAKFPLKIVARSEGAFWKE